MQQLDTARGRLMQHMTGRVGEWLLAILAQYTSQINQFKASFRYNLDTESYDKSKTNLEGNVLCKDQHSCQARPSCAPSGPAFGSGLTLVLILDLVLPCQLVLSIYTSDNIDK